MGKWNWLGAGIPALIAAASGLALSVLAAEERGTLGDLPGNLLSGALITGILFSAVLLPISYSAVKRRRRTEKAAAISNASIHMEATRSARLLGALTQNSSIRQVLQWDGTTPRIFGLLGGSEGVAGWAGSAKEPRRFLLIPWSAIERVGVGSVLEGLSTFPALVVSVSVGDGDVDLPFVLRANSGLSMLPASRSEHQDIAQRLSVMRERTA